MPPPTDFDADGIARSAAMRSAFRMRLRDLSPAHFPVRFPEVFLREPGGFDVLVGNPPWEKVMVDETTFWSTRMPGFRGLPPLREQRRDDRGVPRGSDPISSRAYEAEVAAMDRLRRVLVRRAIPGHERKAMPISTRRSAGGPGSSCGKAVASGVVLPRAALSGVRFRGLAYG